MTENEARALVEAARAAHSEAIDAYGITSSEAKTAFYRLQQAESLFIDIACT